MAPKCFCGAFFSTHNHLRTHVESKGHRFQCSCGALFRELPAVLNHQREAQHAVAATHTTLQPLQELVRSPNVDAVHVNVCVICKRTFANADGVTAHRRGVHPECPGCHQVFATTHQRLTHQKASGHCYCDEHNITFGDTSAFKAHERSEPHVTGFECIPCDRSFGGQRALDDHLIICELRAASTTPEDQAAAIAATITAIDEANLHCQVCNRDFKNLKALRQHKASVKHNKICDSTCPAQNCNKVFTSYSALLLHLESGKCKSGINRQKLNDIVHLHDTDRHITYAVNSRASVSSSRSTIAGSTFGGSRGTASSALNSALSRLSLASSIRSGVISEVDESDTASTVTSLGSGVVLTPDASDASDASSTISARNGVILTPSVSSADDHSVSNSEVIWTPSSSSRATSEWDFVSGAQSNTPQASSVDGSTTSTVTYGAFRGVVLCNLCGKSFRRQAHLLQHLNSPAHAVKLFHCPPNAVLGLANGKQPKAFKTLSGFASHLESGACSGGRDTLNTLVGIVEDRFTAATGRTGLLRNA